MADWPELRAAAATRWGDARLGTLATSVSGCVMAVGAGASLAAARPDGSLDRYETVPQFLAGGGTTPCALTLVDAGQDFDHVVSALAGQPAVTLIVTGIGPPPDSASAGLQVIYRLGSGPAGWLTSATTRRTGVVTLPDLTRTLIDSGRPSAAPPNALLDGAPMGLIPAPVSVADEREHLQAISSLSDAVRGADIALSAAGVVLLVVLILGLARRRLHAPRLILALGTVLPAAMMLTGAAAWNRASSPSLSLTALVGTFALVLTATALGLARAARAPSRWLARPSPWLCSPVTPRWGAHAARFDAQFPALERRSMVRVRQCHLRRVRGSRTSPCRLGGPPSAQNRSRAVGPGRRGGDRVRVIICDGWPSMGADCGVLALTPGVLWLLLSLSGLVLSWRKVVAIGASTLVLVTVVALADWLRGPMARTHAGAFFQRMLDGDATDVVARKAVAAAESLMNPSASSRSSSASRCGS